MAKVKKCVNCGAIIKSGKGKYCQGIHCRTARRK
jgi:hypothetical protein